MKAPVLWLRTSTRSAARRQRRRFPPREARQSLHVWMLRRKPTLSMVEDTVARWGKIDILFNNAGVVLVKPLEEMTEAEWDRVMAINVKAAFLAIKHVAPHMRRNGGGAILNTGSIASFTGQLKTPAYSA